nr:zinc carboxypeptidase A 1 [Helicoverpa armigera]
MSLKIIPIISILILSVASEPFRFDNYTLYKVLPKNLEEIKLLEDLQNSGADFDFWDDPVPTADYINVLSKPELKNDLEGFLAEQGIDFVITLPNIQELIDKEKKKRYTRSNVKTMEWDDYYTLEDIYDWLDDLAKAFPDVVSTIVGGTSHEGRIIKGVKISHGPGRRAVFIESGIHAREWIAPATANYVINQLLYSNDEETKAAAREFDWYIFPVTNPDGYIWTHVGYRLWRKNRRKFGDEYGVDLNRNWNDNWLVIGASSNPASNTYAGPGPFSEMETRTLASYIANMAYKIDLYLSFHSSGQILLLPFGNTTEPLANYYDAMKIGRRALGALAFRHGTQYTIGNIAEAIYFAAGTSVDWVKEHLKVPLTYCYELRDRGVYGHLLPPDQILPTGEETMDSIIEMVWQAKRFGYMKASLQDSDPRFDFWTEPSVLVNNVDVLSSPEHKSEFESLLKAYNVEFVISNPNIQEAIDREPVKTYTQRNLRSMTWNSYYDLDGINHWIDDLAISYPSIVTILKGGTTYEGREIKGLKISHGEGRRIIFLEGGIHSREWISPATVNFITNELLTSNDEETIAAARDFDWYIFPVTNPDGYIWTHTVNRMWRKNRRPVGNHVGIDLNRNWNNNWLVVGASSNPALDTYAGLGPFSEPETRSLSTFIESIGDKIDMYLSFHSYSQLLMLPFGNTTEPLANYEDAMKIGRRAMGALSVRYGTSYETGNIAEVIYQASGGSVDWVKERLKVPLVYCYELRDNGTHGFILPEDQILPNNLEVMDSVLELILQARRFGYMSSGNIVHSSVLLIFMALLAKLLQD